MLNSTPSEDQQLGRIEAGLDALNDKLTVHTDQDMSQFDALFEKLDNLDDKLDAMLLREAHQQGEKAAARRMTMVVAGMISSVVSIVGAFIMKAFGV